MHKWVILPSRAIKKGSIEKLSTEKVLRRKLYRLGLVRWGPGAALRNKATTLSPEGALEGLVVSVGGEQWRSKDFIGFSTLNPVTTALGGPLLMLSQLDADNPTLSPLHQP